MQSRTYPKEVVDQILRGRGIGLDMTDARSLMAKSKTDTPSAKTDDKRRAWARTLSSWPWWLC